MSNTNKSKITITVTADQKRRAEAIAAKMGISLSTAIQLFIDQMITENGMPFKPSNQSSELDLAVEEADSGNLKKYSVPEFHQHLTDLADPLEE